MKTTTTNHHPTVQHHEEHLLNNQQEGVRDEMNFNVLPHTEVPAYLIDTPLQEQQRHLDSFHRNQPHANHAHDKASFSRPGLADHLELISRNLADDFYFEMPWRAPFNRRIETGDGEPDTVTKLT
jgi:hypothetical protein